MKSSNKDQIKGELHELKGASKRQPDRSRQPQPGNKGQDENSPAKPKRKSPDFEEVLEK